MHTCNNGCLEASSTQHESCTQLRLRLGSRGGLHTSQDQEAEAQGNLGQKKGG